MIDKSTWWMLIAIIAIFVIGMFVQKSYQPFSVSGSETMTRTSSATTVAPGSTFTISYTALGVNGLWGATVIDSVSGGCTISVSGTPKTSLQFAMLSDLPNPLTYTVTAPSSGSCTFTGDYQFGNFPVKPFPNLIINMCNPSCIRPSNLCLATSSDGCGGSCLWTVTQNTLADTNCDGLVSRLELGDFINKWIAGTATRTELGNAIMAWIA